MKHTHSILPLLLAAVLLAGCDRDTREIKATAYGYVMATGNFQIDEAMSYATRATRETSLQLVKDLLPLTDSNYLKAAVPATATIDSVYLYTDTALAFYTKTTPLGVSSDTLMLIKEDGKWLVDAPLAQGEPAASPDSVRAK